MYARDEARTLRRSELHRPALSSVTRYLTHLWTAVLAAASLGPDVDLQRLQAAGGLSLPRGVAPPAPAPGRNCPGPLQTSERRSSGTRPGAGWGAPQTRADHERWKDPWNHGALRPCPSPHEGGVPRPRADPRGGDRTRSSAPVGGAPRLQGNSPRDRWRRAHVGPWPRRRGPARQRFPNQGRVGPRSALATTHDTRLRPGSRPHLPAHRRSLGPSGARPSARRGRGHVL